MKKYYKATIIWDLRSVIADTETGKITVFYRNNGNYMVLEGTHSTVIDPVSQTSDFESRLRIFVECNLSDIESNITLLKNYINSF